MINDGEDMSTEDSTQSPAQEYRNPYYTPPKTDPHDDKSINPQDYPVPHKFMWALRGIPMGEFNGTTIPPINLPPECQHALAVHLELCGFEHNIDNQVIVHLKPVVGDDTPMNPGTWIRKSEAPEDKDLISPMGVVDVLESDFAGLEAEQLDILEHAIKKAKIAKQMAAQADPKQRAEAEKLLKEQATERSTMPSEEELRAAMDPNWSVDREPTSGQEKNTDTEEGDKS